METEAARRQQWIESAMSRGAGETPEVVLQLWDSLASELISIIGQGGFTSLYDRSIYLAGAVFPWLPASGPSNTVEQRFSALTAALTQADKTQAKSASHRLFLTFLNILATLIGESLTTDILISAWRGDASTLNHASKEFPNE